MEPTTPTFPTLRRWRKMSEPEQDALIARIERRRRWRAFAWRSLTGLCAAGILAGAIVILMP